jgi:CBS domain-containing protein
MLLTGSEPQFMRHDLAHPDEAPVVSPNELWWPPAKIAGHYLGPLILSLDEESARDHVEAAEPEVGVAVHVELDPDSAMSIDADSAAEGDSPAEEAVGDLATGPLLLVAPEDTLGEVAARLCELDIGSAVVAEYGKTIGIVTTRDLLGAFAGRVHPSEARVRAWMTAHPFTIRASQSKAAAVALMTEHDVHHLPIVDEGGHPIAILGLRDVVSPGSSPLARPVR